MSYKDLEESIRAKVQAFEDDLRAKMEKKLAKQLDKVRRANKRARGSVSRPERPVKYEMEVVLNLRAVMDGKLGDLIEMSYTIETMSEVEAELEAIKKAKVDGFVWRGTVSVLPAFK